MSNGGVIPPAVVVLSSIASPVMQFGRFKQVWLVALIGNVISSAKLNEYYAWKPKSAREAVTHLIFALLGAWMPTPTPKPGLLTIRDEEAKYVSKEKFFGNGLNRAGTQQEKWFNPNRLLMEGDLRPESRIDDDQIRLCLFLHHESSLTWIHELPAMTYWCFMLEVSSVSGGIRVASA